MEIIGIALVVGILAAVFVFLLRSSTRPGRTSGRPRATGAGDGHRRGDVPDPKADRPAGPTAETNMGPSPGVLHPDAQHDADGRTGRRSAKEASETDRGADPDQSGDMQ